MRQLLWAAIAFAAAALPAQGQPYSQPPSVYDRSLAIQQGLQTNKDLAAARLIVNRAAARLEATGLRPNPSLEVEYVDDFAFNDEGESAFGIGFSQAFPLAGKLAKEKAVSRVAIAKAKMEVRRQERALAKTISDFALDIHLADTRNEHLQQVLAAARSAADFAAEKAQTGELSSLEAGQFQLERRILEQEIKNLELERERLMHRLAPHLGQPATQHFDFDSAQVLPYRSGSLPDFDLDVLQRDPDFQLAVLEEQAAEAEIALAQAENWDAVTARLFWRNQKGIDRPVGRTSDQVLGLSFSLPLLLRKKGDLAARERFAQREQSRLSAAAARFRIQNEIEHARHEAHITQERMQAYQSEVLDFAQTQLEQTQLAYQNGQVDPLALHRAQQQLLSLKNGYLDLYEQYAHALLELELARLDIPELQK